jgi:thioredoxin-like negative regulator of GroEL
MPILQDGQNAIAQGNLQQARLIFEAILQEDPRDEDAWLALGDVLTETEDKRICYENALKINKDNQAAREALRNLEPQADPLVQALAPQPPPIEEEEEFDFDEDETVVSDRPDFASATETEEDTSTATLVAVGLALSVVVFAIVGGLAFFLITSLAG